MAQGLQKFPAHTGQRQASSGALRHSTPPTGFLGSGRQKGATEAYSSDRKYSHTEDLARFPRSLQSHTGALARSQITNAGHELLERRLDLCASVVCAFEMQVLVDASDNLPFAGGGGLKRSELRAYSPSSLGCSAALPARYSTAMIFCLSPLLLAKPRLA